jgi:uncharacterized Zn-binding protein involved in type VI secretion
MPPAARVTDMHVCPMVTGIVPHVGGPILPPGCPTVLIGGLPAARATDMATCVGPPDMIAMGSPTVMIGSLMAARIADPTVHGGMIVLGLPTVEIGEVGMGSPVFVDMVMALGAALGAAASAVSAAAAAGPVLAAAICGAPASAGGPQGASLVAAADSGKAFCDH